ncbi:double-stranded RNA binding protein [Goatpox virus]|uniref:Double-stranded RNA binding protein n=1 Tax=Goatpox virus TaxID=186805 RepID=A0A5C0PTI8_9POXV|nr:double-stranded RNA binding protein [Goatpox virus]QEJ79332.1 double-stranded RNA binding protein [Goatpox virus]QEJ79482.1 double-stranded RNA binding protein [Goatpox virus]
MYSFDEVDSYELVKKMVNNLSESEFITAIEISKKLNIEKANVNKQLYKLHNDGFIFMIRSNPPKWFKKNGIDNNDNDNNDMKKLNKSFSDTIPYYKIVLWKEKNPCSAINEYCQFTSRDWYINISSCGNGRKPMFLASVIISGIKFFPEIGNTKKEAKQKSTKRTIDFLINTSIIKF